VRLKEFQAQGKMLLAIVSSDPEPPLRTMAVLTGRENAEEFARGDPFLVVGEIERHETARSWITSRLLHHRFADAADEWQRRLPTPSTTPPENASATCRSHPTA